MFCIEVCFMVIKCFIWYLHLIFTYAAAQILALTIFIRIKQTNIIENNWLLDRLHFFFFSYQANGCGGQGTWSVYDSQCYSCIANAVPWQTARASCQQLGGDLVTINNAETQSFLERTETF